MTFEVKLRLMHKNLCLYNEITHKKLYKVLIRSNFNQKKKYLMKINFKTNVTFCEIQLPLRSTL